MLSLQYRIILGFGKHTHTLLHTHTLTHTFAHTHTHTHTFARVSGLKTIRLEVPKSPLFAEIN